MNLFCGVLYNVLTNLASRFDLVTREEVGPGFCHRSPNGGKPGLGYIKPALKCSLTLVNNESVMGTLTGVAWNALSTLLSFCLTW